MMIFKLIRIYNKKRPHLLLAFFLSEIVATL